MKAFPETRQVVVVFASDFSTGQAVALLENMRRHLESGTRHFEFDMKQLRNVDSFGWGVLALILKKAAEYGGRVTVKGLNESLKELFGIISGKVNLKIKA